MQPIKGTPCIIPPLDATSPPALQVNEIRVGIDVACVVVAVVVLAVALGLPGPRGQKLRILGAVDWSLGASVVGGSF